jgi:hypothetical protein
VTTKEFVSVLEDYYGAPYRPSVKIAIFETVNGLSGKYLSVLYKMLRMGHSNQYKQPPDELAIRKIMSEVDEAYPEFRANSYNQQLEQARLMIGDDADQIPRAANCAYIEHIHERMRLAKEAGWKASEVAKEMNEEYYRNWVRTWQEENGN